jgi:hypothetical protein
MTGGGVNSTLARCGRARKGARAGEELPVRLSCERAVSPARTLASEQQKADATC